MSRELCRLVPAEFEAPSFLPRPPGPVWGLVQLSTLHARL